MKIRTLPVFLLILALSPALSAFECPDYADQRLVSLLESMALITESIEQIDEEWNRSLGNDATGLRELIAERDPDTLRATCHLLGRFPSLESVLAESAATLKQPTVRSWLAQTTGPVDPEQRTQLLCLSDSEYRDVRAVMGALIIADQIAQAVCDGLSCVNGLCRICNALPAFGIVVPPFEYGLAIDGLNCDTQHVEQMEGFCRNALGFCGAARSTARTLSDLEALLAGSITVSIMTLSNEVASQETLDGTRALIEDRAARTSDQLDTLSSLIRDDDARRRDFQADLKAIDIEAALGNPSAPTPVDLQLPMSVGGRLEVVREIVADAIASSLQAGLEINDALPLLRDGDDALNAGAYGEAFQAYRLAYQELLR